MHKIIHVDMDCYFAALEMRDHPQWRAIPLAVGGAADKRGVIATCNYVARRYGVHSAMATAHALRLCPGLKVVPGRMALYQQVSAQIRAIFARYTDLVEPLSLDEAYLDVTDSPHCHGSATLIAQAIREDIRRELQLTASAGVAPNKFLAKIASEQNKPDGLFVLPPERVAAFVAVLPLSKIPGIGEKSAQRLAAAGLHRCADVLAYPRHLLLARFGKTGQMLLERARGMDERSVQVSRLRKSVGVETTLATDLQQEGEGWQVVQALLPDLRRRLARHCDARKICRQGVKVKFADFRQTTVERAVQGLDEVLFASLLHEAWQRGEGKAVRLVGLSVGLPAPTQMEQLALPF